jgi:uncharacterized glyoxalase superfamily protein PhnB
MACVRHIDVSSGDRTGFGTVSNHQRLLTRNAGVSQMLALKHHPVAYQPPTAVSLRVANVRRAAELYQRIGFSYVMSVPDENGDWLLCLLGYGTGSILLGSQDDPRFPQTGGRHDARIELTVADVMATYTACVTANCRITVEPVHDPWRAPSFSCLDPFGYEWQFTQAAEPMGFDRANRGARALWS